MPLQDVQVLNDLCSNVSDHYPVVIKIQSQVRTSSDTATCNTKRRIPWKKVDLDVYKRTVAMNINHSPVDCHEESINAAVEEINNTLRQASEESCTVSLSKQASKKKTNKLKVWNKDIAEAIKRSRKSHSDWKWKNAGKPNHLSSSALVEKKEARLELRRHIRIANARLIVKQQEEIMEARENDVKKLYKLIQKHRGALDNYISELHVGEVTYSGTDVNNGWKQHFESLATPTPNENFDSEYIAMVQRDITYLSSCCQGGNEVIHFTEDEVAKAVQSLNRNKAEDIYGLSTEHLLYAGMPIIKKITDVINAIMSTGHIPPTLKEGIITPIFKNKGSKFDSKNYRGITVTPIITKVQEALLLTLVRPKIESIQNPLQRGFTKNASPLMAATILEETIREAKDSKSCLFTAYLDAKSAFDVVDHSSLFRKLYIAGVQGRVWEIIKDLHTETTSVVKWRGELSEPFRILQGVKQGGLLSTELYKLYVNDLLDRLQQSGLGKRIGHIDCSAPSCADDVALLANNAYSLQGLLDISVNYSNKERYVLQPTKSAVLKIQTGNRSAVEEPTFTLQDSEVQVQDQATHLGLIRNSKANPVDSIDSNIQKARRRLYSLMRPGLHGENGLDPITCIQLYSVYVTPILLYGIEICPPNKTQLQKLDLFSKRTLKQILSLPVTTADSAVYILSGILPIEAQLDKKIMMHFGAITRLPESSTEVQLAYRQLYLKDENSNSWIILVKKILQKYNLPEPISLLDYPPSAQQWKNIVNNTVNERWRISIMEEAYTKSTLKNLNIDAFIPGKRHPILYTESANARDVSRLRTKLLLATGTYILQINRKAFNQNAVKATCLMCNTEDETKEHFLLRCPSLQETRSEIMVELKKEVCHVVKTPMHIFENSELFTQLIIDSSAIPDVKDGGLSSGRLNFLTRVLCFRLHTQRFKELEKVKCKKLS